MILRSVLPKAKPHLTAGAVGGAYIRTSVPNLAPSPVKPVTQSVVEAFNIGPSAFNRFTVAPTVATASVSGRLHLNAPPAPGTANVFDRVDELLDHLAPAPTRAEQHQSHLEGQERTDLLVATAAPLSNAGTHTRLHSDFGPESEGGLPSRALPAPLFTEITVQPGDTIYRLAQRSGIPAQYIAAASAAGGRLNNLHRLSVGQRLIVPHEEALQLPALMAAAQSMGAALKHYDKQYAAHRKEHQRRETELKTHQAQARQLAQQMGLPAGQLPHELNAFGLPATSLPSAVPHSESLSTTWVDPHFVGTTSRRLSEDRFHASIHNHVASNSGALEALSGAYHKHQVEQEQDQRPLAKLGRAVQDRLLRALPVVYMLSKVASHPQTAKYFHNVRVEHETKAQGYQQQIERKGGVNEWSQVNVARNGWGDVVNYGSGLIIGTVPVLAEAALGGIVGRGMVTAGRALASSAQAIQLGGTVGMLQATTLPSLGSILDAQRDQAGQIHLPTAVALTPLFVAANAVGITGRIGQGTLLKNTIGKIDQIPGMTGFVTRTAGNTGKLSLTEGLAETWQEGVVSQWARMKVDKDETFSSERAAHRRYEAFAGGAFMGGIFGVGGGRRSSSSASAQQPSFTNVTTAAAQQAPLKLVVDNGNSPPHLLAGSAEPMTTPAMRLAASPGSDNVDKQAQPGRSQGIPDETSVAWLLEQSQNLLPGKQGVWVSEGWTDDQLLQLAEKLDAEVALTLIDGQLYLTSGTPDSVNMAPEYKFKTAALLRHVRLDSAAHNEQNHEQNHEQPSDIAGLFHALSVRARPNARITPSGVITRGQDGTVQVKYFGPTVDFGLAKTFNAQELNISSAPNVTAQLRVDEVYPERATVRISSLEGTPNIEEINQAVHRQAQALGIKWLRLEWDTEGATPATTALQLLGISKEPRYDFTSGRYIDGKLITRNESTSKPGAHHIFSLEKTPSTEQPTSATKATSEQAPLFSLSDSEAPHSFGFSIDHMPAQNRRQPLSTEQTATATKSFRASGSGVVNYLNLWEQSTEQGVELLSERSGHARDAHEHAGQEDSVSAKIDPLNVRSLVHTHIHGETDAQARRPHPQDVAELERINRVRRSSDLPELVGSFRYGHKPHHVGYFGVSELQLPFNAWLMNELERTRHLITGVIASAPEASFQVLNFPNGSVRTKTIGGTTVVRIANVENDGQLMDLMGRILFWAKGLRDSHTVRIESESSVLEQARHLLFHTEHDSHFTVEDFYNFGNGQYDLSQNLGVLTYFPKQNLGEALQAAPKLRGADRAYALQTLYFAKHLSPLPSWRPYLALVNTAPDLTQGPIKLGADGRLDLTFHSPSESKPAWELEEDHAARTAIDTSMNVSALQVLRDFLKKIQTGRQNAISKNKEASEGFTWMASQMRLIAKVSDALEQYAKQIGINSVALVPRLEQAFSTKDQPNGLAGAIAHVEQQIMRAQHYAHWAQGAKAGVVQLISEGRLGLLSAAADLLAKDQNAPEHAHQESADLQELEHVLRGKANGQEDSSASLNDALQTLTLEGESIVEALRRIAADPRKWLVDTAAVITPLGFKGLKGPLANASSTQLPTLLSDDQSLQLQQARTELAQALGYASWHLLTLVEGAALQNIAFAQTVRLNMKQLLEAGQARELVFAAAFADSPLSEHRPQALAIAQRLGAQVDGEITLEALAKLLRRQLAVVRFPTEHNFATVAIRIESDPGSWLSKQGWLQLLTPSDVNAKLTNEERIQLQRAVQQPNPELNLEALLKKLGYSNLQQLRWAYAGNLTQVHDEVLASIARETRIRTPKKQESSQDEPSRSTKSTASENAKPERVRQSSAKATTKARSQPIVLNHSLVVLGNPPQISSDQWAWINQHAAGHSAAQWLEHLETNPPSVQDYPPDPTQLKEDVRALAAYVNHLLSFLAIGQGIDQVAALDVKRWSGLTHALLEAIHGQGSVQTTSLAHGLDGDARNDLRKGKWPPSQFLPVLQTIAANTQIREVLNSPMGAPIVTRLRELLSQMRVARTQVDQDMPLAQAVELLPLVPQVQLNWLRKALQGASLAQLQDALATTNVGDEAQIVIGEQTTAIPASMRRDDLLDDVRQVQRYQALAAQAVGVHMKQSLLDQATSRQLSFFYSALNATLEGSPAWFHDQQDSINSRDKFGTALNQLLGLTPSNWNVMRLMAQDRGARTFLFDPVWGREFTQQLKGLMLQVETRFQALKTDIEIEPLQVASRNKHVEEASENAQPPLTVVAQQIEGSSTGPTLTASHLYGVEANGLRFLEGLIQTALARGKFNRSNLAVNTLLQPEQQLNVSSGNRNRAFRAKQALGVAGPVDDLIYQLSQRYGGGGGEATTEAVRERLQHLLSDIRREYSRAARERSYNRMALEQMAPELANSNQWSFAGTTPLQELRAYKLSQHLSTALRWSMEGKTIDQMAAQVGNGSRVIWNYLTRIRKTLGLQPDGDIAAEVMQRTPPSLHESNFNYLYPQQAAVLEFLERAKSLDVQAMNRLTTPDAKAMLAAVSALLADSAYLNPYDPQGIQLTDDRRTNHRIKGALGLQEAPHTTLVAYANAWVQPASRDLIEQLSGGGQRVQDVLRQLHTNLVTHIQALTGAAKDTKTGTQMAGALATDSLAELQSVWQALQMSTAAKAAPGAQEVSEGTIRDAVLDALSQLGPSWRTALQLELQREIETFGTVTSRVLRLIIDKYPGGAQRLLADVIQKFFSQPTRVRPKAKKTAPSPAPTAVQIPTQAPDQAHKAALDQTAAIPENTKENSWVIRPSVLYGLEGTAMAFLNKVVERVLEGKTFDLQKIFPANELESINFFRSRSAIRKALGLIDKPQALVHELSARYSGASDVDPFAALQMLRLDLARERERTKRERMYNRQALALQETAPPAQVKSLESYNLQPHLLVTLWRLLHGKTQTQIAQEENLSLDRIVGNHETSLKTQLGLEGPDVATSVLHRYQNHWDDTWNYLAKINGAIASGNQYAQHRSQKFLPQTVQAQDYKNLDLRHLYALAKHFLTADHHKTLLDALFSNLQAYPQHKMAAYVDETNARLGLKHINELPKKFVQDLSRPDNTDPEAFRTALVQEIERRAEERSSAGAKKKDRGI